MSPDIDPSSKPDSVINVREAIAYTAGDLSMLHSMAELLLEEGPAQLKAIETDVRSGDLEGIRKGAHTLKGSIVIFAAREAHAAALNLERLSGSGKSSQVDEAWATLSREMKRLFDDAARLCDSSAR